MRANIRRILLHRIVIVGGGLGGLRIAMGLKNKGYQIVLIDKNNYNQFPPLIYQIASSGIEPSNVSFPFRRIFQGCENFFFRMGEVLFIDEKEKAIRTTFGTVHYDELILAAGATTNFFGNAHFEHDTLPMKTVDDAIHLRNTILERLEMAETEDNPEHRQAFMNIVIVGGGPSGVEIAGALAEMKRTVLPRDYADLDASQMHIYLVNAADRLLSTMDKASSEKAEKGLKELGVEIMNNCMAMDYTNSQLILKDHTPLTSKTVIWVSGIKANTIGGIPSTSIGRGARILVDRYNRVKGMQDVYAIGDQCLVEGDELYPYGHPQLAQVAIQQAANVAANIERLQNDKPMRLFSYNNVGVMATIGRKKAVVEIGKLKFGGFFAWLLWLIVHLRSILGVRNKTIVLLNWMWSYLNYKQSLRLIFRPKEDEEDSLP